MHQVDIGGSLETSAGTKTPLDCVDLPTRVVKAFLRAGLETIEDVEALTDDEILCLRNVGPGAVAQFRDAVMRSATRAKPEVSVPATVVPTAARTLTSTLYDELASVDVRELVDTTPKLVQRVLESFENARAWQIVERRFGLGGVRKRTLEELAGAYGLTRERIRQVEAKSLKTLAAVMTTALEQGGSPSGLARFYQYITATATRAIRHDALIARLELEGRSNEVFGSIQLLMELKAIHAINVSEGEIGLLWTAWTSEEQATFGRVVRGLHVLLTRDEVLAMESFDLLMSLNSRLSAKDRLAASELDGLLELCGFVERTPIGAIQAQFHRLQGRGNQVLRLLNETGGSLSLRSLVRTINARCVPNGVSKLAIANLSNQLSLDQRFEPIGKSGHWRLKGKSRSRSVNIVDLMEEFLIERDHCASEAEIFAHVSSQRPVSPSSITLFLNRQPPTFVEVRRGAGD